MWTQFRSVLRNIRLMLAIAWQMDKRLTVLYYLTAALTAVAPVATGFTFKLLIDHVVATPGVAVTVPLVIVAILATHCALLAATTAVSSGLHDQYYDYLFRYKLQNEFAYRFSDKLTHLDIAHIEDPEVQNLITNVRETHQWRMPDFLRMLSYFCTAAVAYVSAAIVLATFAWWAVPVLTLVTLPRLYLRARFGNMQWSFYGSGAPGARRLWYFGWLLSENNSLRETKIFQTGPALLDKYKAIQDELFELHKKPLERFRVVTTLAPLIEGGAMFLVAWLVLPQAIDRSITIGAYAFFVTMLQQLVTAAAAAGVQGGAVYENSLFVDFFVKLTALPRLIKEREDPVRFEPLVPPHIEFRAVSFAYPNGQSVLEDVSFTVEPGENVALVGINGAGKSTIVKLLCRFYDVTHGAILINGVDIRELELANWYSHLGTLFQDFVQYRLTVRDNILLGDTSKVDDELVVAAATKAGASPFIDAMPQRYDQMLGNDEDGVQLSGGQWQKLAIARAFYQSAPVLILDEPTSAIDAEAEFEIFNQLEAEYRDKTLLLVSHRFSTVRNADRILVIDSGRVIEAGTHEELMTHDGKYAAMFSVQAAGYR